MSFLLNPSRFTPVLGGITLIGSDSGDANRTTSAYVVTFSKTLLENDLVIINVGEIGSGSDNPPTAPAGYTTIVRQTGGNVKHAIFYKFMGASPDTSVSITPDNAGRHGQVVSYFRGVNTSSPITEQTANTVVSNPDSGLQYTTSALTSVLDGGMVVEFQITYTVTNTANWYNISDGFTEIGLVANTTEAGLGSDGAKSVGAWYKEFPTGGAVALRTYKHNHTNTFGLYYIALSLNPA
jgi:hypothetical protein